MILHYETWGEGQPVVLLHGMASSGHYWQRLITERPAGYKFIAIDLLGFGHSPKPRDVTYDPATHVAALQSTLTAAGVNEPYIVVAHSMGALLALHMAAVDPSMVRQLILCGLPYYPDSAAARRDITRNKRLWRLAYYGPTSHALCTVWCKWMRPLTQYLAPLYLSRLPEVIAKDSLLHTWRSYSESMSNVIENQNIQADLSLLAIPIVFMYGAEDACGEYLQASGLVANKPQVDLQIYPSLTHQLPLEQPKLVIAQLLDAPTN